MPTITTRGNITATSYGFGSAGGAAVNGSYFLAIIKNNAGASASIVSIANTATGELLFTAYASSQQIYAKLTNTGTLSWGKLSGTVGYPGYIASDGAGTAYTWIPYGIVGGPKFSESTGTLTNWRYSTSAPIAYADNYSGSLLVSGSGSYIHAIAKGYDAGYKYAGAGAVVLANTGGMPYRTAYSTTDKSWGNYASKMTAVTSTTSLGVFGGGTSGPTNSAIVLRYSFDGINTPNNADARQIYNNAGYQSSADKIYGCVMDSSGNAYIAGYMMYDGTSYSLVNFFACLSNSGSAWGSISWIRKVGTSNAYPGDAALDGQGNVYFAYVGWNGIRIVKYTTSGTFVWCRDLNFTSSYGPVKITTDSVSFWISAPQYGGPSVIFRAPLDGSKTGTYGGYTYSVGATSDSAFTNYVYTAYSVSNSVGNGGTGATSQSATSNTPSVTTTTIT